MNISIANVIICAGMLITCIGGSSVTARRTGIANARGF
jgi:hypothetical protein